MSISMERVQHEIRTIHSTAVDQKKVTSQSAKKLYNLMKEIKNSPLSCSQGCKTNAINDLNNLNKILTEQNSKLVNKKSKGINALLKKINTAKVEENIINNSIYSVGKSSYVPINNELYASQEHIYESISDDINGPAEPIYESINDDVNGPAEPIYESINDDVNGPAEPTYESMYHDVNSSPESIYKSMKAVITNTEKGTYSKPFDNYSDNIYQKPFYDKQKYSNSLPINELNNIEKYIDELAEIADDIIFIRTPPGIRPPNT
ncbi:MULTISPECIES: hypothetical protein [unclassified Yersinia (in: enterobacteria)]|uniref:hypothetical protein n=1 Tax=unclassified Yersinia (in: enterobacteria) TaxID=2653513 RepID=UPI000EADAC97|nr:hypothetical protein [Yersinia sp. IP36721]